MYLIDITRRTNMKYTPSINIAQTVFNPESYIVTQNALGVVGNIVDSFNAGVHSFNIIGSYGTGKSNFILALEHGLQKGSKLITNKGQFNGFARIHFEKIVGDYASLQKVLTEHFFPTEASDNLFENLRRYFQKAAKREQFVVLVIDEFGKLLEYAAKNNPERELYLFQKFTEFINDERRNAILLTTLHQNFNSYARSLTESQRNEWTKVKGRFKEIVFNEPVEQLLYLASKRIEQSQREVINHNFEQIYNLAITSKFASSSIAYDTELSLYPLDLFAAQALTLSIQRYGQNERTLFSFLEATGQGSLQAFEEKINTTYSLADVYDYDIYNFYSYLSEVNSDSAAWTGIRVGLERVEGLFEGEIAADAIKLIKTIGMLNLFGKAGVQLNKEGLSTYAKFALGINNPEAIIELLTQHKIIRYATYKSQYILFEGTDVNIEGELLKAAGIVPRSKDVVEKLIACFNLPTEFANASYFRKGTPRYFKYEISDNPKTLIPQDEIDGYINLIFNENLSVDNLKQYSAGVDEAILYAYFKKADQVIDHVWQLDKLAYVQNDVDSKDNVAQKEIKALITHEQNLLNASVLNTLFNFSDDVVWVYRGEVIDIPSKAIFNKWLSTISDDVYSDTPIYINEMVNKHKPSGAMSTARVNFLAHLLENGTEANLGFEEGKFPPEKTIYLTLLHNTGIHRRIGREYLLDAPTQESFLPLWRACEAFLDSTKEKPRKLGELIKILRSRPFKLKQGVIDLWLPAFLIIKKNDYSLYNDTGIYIPTITREVLDIMQKSPAGFSVKAFNVEGVKLDLFNKYREALSLSQDAEFTADSLIETIKPFLLFYKKLNKYAKQTKRLDKTTVKFRAALASAKDPEKTFFEDLPRALGFKDAEIAENTDVLMRYVELLQKAIRELRVCYSNLISRLESVLVEELGLKSKDYASYKAELEQRYSAIKTYLLTERQKTFLTRVLAQNTDRVTWYQSLAYVVLDKQLEALMDEEEAYLIDNLVHSFKELLKYAELSNKGLTSDDNFFRFEMISNDGAATQQIVQLSSAKAKQAKSLEAKIDKLLSGDSDIDAYALLSIIKKKLNND